MFLQDRSMKNLPRLLNLAKFEELYETKYHYLPYILNNLNLKKYINVEQLPA